MVLQVYFLHIYLQISANFTTKICRYYDLHFHIKNVILYYVKILCTRDQYSGGESQIPEMGKRQ